MKFISSRILFFLFLILLTENASAVILCEVTNQDIWPGGYQLEVTLTNAGPNPVSEWNVLLDFQQSSQFTLVWNVQLKGDKAVTATNLSWNGNLAVGEKTTFGFLGIQNGNFVKPLCTDTGIITDPPIPPTPIVIDVDRSLFIHDEATLQGEDFSFQRVIQQLTTQLNALNPTDPITPEQLFARMWDTQNLFPGKVLGGEKCTGILNEFPQECRSAEGSQVDTPSDFIAKYKPIALVNRLDLRDTKNFNDCGEYRIIFGLTESFGRNFIIFEAQVPNPEPGVASGCLPIAKFWQKLSAEENTQVRAGLLNDFYFNGIAAANVRPVIDTRNYGVNGGQIRTNMFMGSSWVLKEFKVAVDSQGFSVIQPVSVKSNPAAILFDGAVNDERTQSFQTAFVTNLDSLLGDFDTFSLTIARDDHNNGQSHASGVDTNENLFSAPFFSNGSIHFVQSVNDKLTRVGSNLSASQVINRATAMTCAGCHNPGAYGLQSPDAVGPNQSWPGTLGFTHINEFALNGSFQLSSALTTVFLPARLKDFTLYLSTQSQNAQSQSTQSQNISTQSISLLKQRVTPAKATPKFSKRSG